LAQRHLPDPIDAFLRQSPASVDAVESLNPNPKTRLDAVEFDPTTAYGRLVRVGRFPALQKRELVRGEPPELPLNAHPSG
jgi:hypothetical protein